MTNSVIECGVIADGQNPVSSNLYIRKLILFFTIAGAGSKEISGLLRTHHIFIMNTYRISMFIKFLFFVCF